MRTLIKCLVRPTFRKAFAADPLRALERADLKGLHADQLEVLAGLSEHDLEVVANVVARLRDAHPERAISI